MRQFIYNSATNIRDWLLAYSFIYSFRFSSNHLIWEWFTSVILSLTDQMIYDVTAEKVRESMLGIEREVAKVVCYRDSQS